MVPLHATAPPSLIGLTSWDNQTTKKQWNRTVCAIYLERLMVFKCSNWVNWVQLDKMDNQLEKSIAKSEQSRKIVENSQIVKLAGTVKQHKLPNLS